MNIESVVADFEMLRQNLEDDLAAISKRLACLLPEPLGATPLPSAISTRLRHALNRNNIHTSEQVEALSDEELLAIRNLGRNSLLELRALTAGLPIPIPERHVQKIHLRLEPPRRYGYGYSDYTYYSVCGQVSIDPGRKTIDHLLLTSDATEVTCRQCQAHIARRAGT